MKKSLYLPLCVLPLLAACTDDNTTDKPDAPDGHRPATSESSAYANKVYEYTPAPGQFINETKTGGFTGDETTAESAANWAKKRMDDGKFVSLGAFGGFITVGFDHSIMNSRGDYDFAIRGNAIESSNEPGVVWVMRDENGNGLPDDTWYQLRGSETGAEGTIENYSVTYYRPDSPGQPVKWTDSEGGNGEISYLKAYHNQPSYYPAWITSESYTLSGTRLQAQTHKDPATGDWKSLPYAWGYADNRGEDTLDPEKQWVGFKISNAIDANGKSVVLPFIDFVKVQQSVMAQTGRLGENSCEVLGIADCSLLKFQ